MQANIPTEARSSRIPRLVAKKGKRNQLQGDSFDRDSGYLGSMAPPNSHPGVGQQPPLNSSPQSSVSQIEEEPEVQSSLSHRPPLQPSYYFPYNPGAVPDTSAVDSLREEVRRLREQLLDGRNGNGVSAAQPPPRASLATQTVKEDDGELSVRDSPRERLSESSFHRPLKQEPAPLTSSDDGDERRRRRRRDGYVRPPQPLEIPSDDGVDDDDSAGDAQRIDEKKNQYHHHREAKSYRLSSESESDRSARRRQRTTPVAKKLFSQSSQTPPKWKSTTATRPREDFATDSSEISSLTTSSSREGDSSLECPHCGNSFANETGQRHRHQTSHSKKCQTPESFLHERAKEEPVEVIRLKKKSKPRRPVRIYLDEDEEEGNGRDEDVVDEPSSILQTRKPKASSTPRVYVADPSPTDSDDERESIVLRRRPRRKERSPAVVVIERDLESPPPPPSPPSPVYVYRRKPRTSTYRFDDDDDYDRHPRTRRSKSAYVLEKDREPRVIRQSKPRYVLEDDDDYGDADDDVHVLYRRRRQVAQKDTVLDIIFSIIYCRSRVRAVPRRTISPVRQSRDVFVSCSNNELMIFD